MVVRLYVCEFVCESEGEGENESEGKYLYI